MLTRYHVILHRQGIARATDDSALPAGGNTLAGIEHAAQIHAGSTVQASRFAAEPCLFQNARIFNRHTTVSLKVRMCQASH